MLNRSGGRQLLRQLPEAIHLMCASKKGISTRQLHRMFG
jgi:hypothetical protein